MLGFQESDKEVGQVRELAQACPPEVQRDAARQWLARKTSAFPNGN